MIDSELHEYLMHFNKPLIDKMNKIERELQELKQDLLLGDLK